jgi:hypothetical protein
MSAKFRNRESLPEQMPSIRQHVAAEKSKLSRTAEKGGMFLVGNCPVPES